MSSRLGLDELRERIGAGDVDTVLVAFPDLQGRLMGKRVTGHYFLDHVVDGEGIEACNYLLAVDVEMTPVPGYQFANWEQGYGDMKAVPDFATLRPVPWLEKTAIVLCDLVDVETATPVEVSPRRILQRQVERAAAAGYAVKCGSELEFFLFRDSYEEAAAKGYADLEPHSPVIEDYHVLQTTRDEYLIADALEMADRHVIYKNGAKEIASLAGRSITFMAKYSMDAVGSSCHVHSSVWDGDGTTSLMWTDEGPHHLSDVFRGWLGGLLATGRELAWLFAPSVNSYKRYQPESWAPTALAWGRDNRTCGFRVVGRGGGFRVESRLPGADVNPYLAFAATIAGGLHGIEHGLDPGAPYDGNAYAGEDLERVPETLVDAIDELERSEVAVKAFGSDVHEHLVNTARQEWAGFNRVVTDWERRRNFEQF
jgi:glutamine synthetase